MKTMKASKVNRYGEKRAFRSTEEEVGDERGGFISAVKDVDFSVFLALGFSNATLVQ